VFPSVSQRETCSFHFSLCQDPHLSLSLLHSTCIRASARMLLLATTSRLQSSFSRSPHPPRVPTRALPLPSPAHGDIVVAVQILTMTGANTTKIPGARQSSTGASGSPRQTTMLLPPRASVSPFGTSRLPRRRQTPTHRSSLPVSRATPSPATNKPLPSPPMAQLVDPNSPPRAQRTLVDAYCGTTAWPAIQPEKIPDRISSKRASLPLPRMPSPTGSVVSNGAWSQAAGSSLDGEEQQAESDIRLKRLSWRTSGSGSGSGPVLTIQADAEALIMGHSDSIPDVPAIPAELPHRSLQHRSLSSLAGRMSRNAASRLSSINTSSSPAPATAGTGPNSSPGTKISPIRSMQPPRKGSFETPTKTNRLPLLSPIAVRSVSGTSSKFTIATAEPDVTAPALSTVPESHTPSSVASNAVCASHRLNALY
jgi:hypothetical protein